MKNMIKKINKRMYSVKINKLLLVLTSLITIFIFQNKVVAQCSVTISQPAEFTAGAIDSTGETICYGTVPSIIGNLDSAKGGRGSIRYEWRSSIDGYASPIPGATSPTYTPPSNLATTTTYRRYAKDSLCNPLYTKSLGSWTVTVIPLDTVTITDTVCAGDSYNDYNFSYVAAYTTTGYTYLDTNENTNVHHCDSVTMLSLYVRPVDSVYLPDTICGGEVYALNGFNIPTVRTTGGYTHLDTNHNTNVHHCDSVTMLSLYVRPVDSVKFTADICAGNTYTGYNFNIPVPYTTTAYTIYDTIRKKNIAGCDSVTTLVLTVLPVDSVAVTGDICAGNTYTGYNFNIPVPYTTTAYTIYDTIRLTNVAGCDSITTLVLHVLAVDSIYIVDSICSGEHYKLNGFDVQTTFSYEEIVIEKVNRTVNINGCDSTTFLTLIVHPIPEVSLGEDISVCHDTVYPVVLDPGAQYSSYMWNTGSRAQTLSVRKGGEYSVVVANEHNCLNSDTVEVVDLTDMYVRIESLYDFCDNMRTILIANTNVDVDELLWNTGEKSESIDVTKSGTYSVTATKMTCQVYDFYVIDSCDFRLFIPNTITPSDNNGLNDCFEIHFPSTYEIANLTIEIYDRWGNKVFHSNSPDFKWYGTTKNGKVAHDNTFVYTLVLEINGVKHTFKGTILVM